jgi:hypothetical protein
VVRLTVDRVVVRGAAPPSRAALTAAIERAVRAEAAASPGLWAGAADGSSTLALRQRADGGSSDAIASALASAVSRGLGGGA